MARVEIASEGWGWVADTTGQAQGGVNVLIKNLDGSNATHYSAITGGTSTTGAVATNADGTIPRYLEEGVYDVTVGAVTRRVAATAGGRALNVTRDYGAKVDGTTDDTAAVQATFDTGSAHVATGTHALTGALTVSQSGTVITGVPGSVLQIKANPGGSRDTRIIQLADGVTDVTIRGVTFDGNGTGFASASFTGGLIRGGASNKRIRIEDCRIVNAFYYFIQFPSTTTTVEDLAIVNNFADGSGMSGGSNPGFFLNNVDRGVISGNVVLNTGDDQIALISPRAAGGDATVAYCRDVVITGNVCDNIKVEGSNITVTGERIVVTDNICRRAKRVGPTSDTDGAIRVRHSDIDTSEYVARDVLIANNLIENPDGPGITASAVRTTIRGNRVYSPNGYGIWVSVSDVALAAGNPALPTIEGWVAVEDNEVLDATSEAIYHIGNIQRLRMSGNRVVGGASVGFRLPLSTTAGRNKALVLEGNKAHGCVGYGFQVGSASGKSDLVVLRGNESVGNSTYGFDINSTQTLTKFYLYDNTATGNTTADWRLASGTVPTDARNNPSLTSNVSSPAVAATTVAVPNPFGIPATVYVTGGTVSNISVDGQSLNLTAGAFRVKPGGSITLSYSVAPTWKWILEP